MVFFAKIKHRNSPLNFLPSDRLSRGLQKCFTSAPTEADDIRVAENGIHVLFQPLDSLGI